MLMAGKFYLSYQKVNFHFKVNDKSLIDNAKNLVQRGAFLGTTKLKNISNSQVVICSINFDIKKKQKIFSSEKDYLKSISNIAKNLNPESLLFIESTLPPGFCEKNNSYNGKSF